MPSRTRARSLVHAPHDDRIEATGQRLNDQVGTGVGVAGEPVADGILHRELGPDDSSEPEFLTREPVVLLLPDEEIVENLDVIVRSLRRDSGPIGMFAAAVGECTTVETVGALADALVTHGGEEREGARFILDGVVSWLLGFGGSEALARMGADDLPPDTGGPANDEGTSDELAS